MSFLHIVGILLMILVAAFGGYMYMGASRLEKEIEAEIRDQETE